MNQKIRIGNDIDITWSILDADEQPYIVEGRNIAVELDVGKKRVRITEFDLHENQIHFIYYGKDQKYLGSHNLKFIENEGAVDMVTFDTEDAFRLMEHSWLAVDEGEEPETVQLEVVTISSELDSKVGPKGDTGDPAGFSVVDAEADANVGTPSVEVTTSGPDTAKNIHFAFHNIKGDKGDPGSDADVTRVNIEAALNSSAGKNLSTEDYTTAEKEKLGGVASGAQVNVIEGVKVNGTVLEPENKAVNVTVPTQVSQLSEDASHRTVTDTEKTTWNDKVNQSQISGFITKSVDDLVNYYLKSETYTKDEVAALIGAIQQFHYEIYASTSAVTDPQTNVLYLIGPTGSGSDKYEEYVYDSTKVEPWVKIGDTSIDLSGYVTTSALNAALADYTTTAQLTQLLAGKQDTIDPQHKLDYSLLSNTPTIPDEVKANPTIPSGTTPTELTGLKIGSNYYNIEGGDPNAVLFTPQTLTDAQKEQARLNIGANMIALTNNEIDALWEAAI